MRASESESSSVETKKAVLPATVIVTEQKNTRRPLFPLSYSCLTKTPSAEKVETMAYSNPSMHQRLGIQEQGRRE